MATKATLQQAAEVVTGDPKATLQEMADVIVRGGGIPGGGGSASSVSVDSTGFNIITSDNVQGALNELDSATKDLQDASSVLTTSEEISVEIGGSTVVLLDELLAMDIDGRPSYKQPGAIVYAENGAVGIIDTVDATNQTATIKTVQYAVATGGGDNGIKGDYCTTYGITDMPNGLISAALETNYLTIPAGIVLKAAGADTLTTLASETVHETTSTTDFTLFYVGGEMLECGDVVYSSSEPTENGVANYQAWFNPNVSKWQFRSNDTGNVWREAVATPLCDCIFSDGALTRIDFIGYRVLNKQEFATKAEIGDIAAVLNAINGESV